MCVWGGGGGGCWCALAASRHTSLSGFSGFAPGHRTCTNLKHLKWAGKLTRIASKSVSEQEEHLNKSRDLNKHSSFSSFW